MRRILVSLLFSVLLLCSVVGLRNLVATQTGSNAPVMVAIGGSPPPPIPPAVLGIGGSPPPPIPPAN